MTDTPSTSTGTYGEGIKWILAIAAAAIGGAFLHLDKIERESHATQVLLGLSLLLFVCSIWSGMNYLLWLNTIPIVRERLKENRSSLFASDGSSSSNTNTLLRDQIRNDEKTISDAELTMPTWHRIYTYSFSAALAISTIGLLTSMFVAGMAKRTGANHNVIVQSTPPVDLKRFSVVYSAVHAAGNGRHEAHTFLINNETGELWQMICDKGTMVRFSKIQRVDAAPVSDRTTR